MIRSHRMSRRRRDIAIAHVLQLTQHQHLAIFDRQLLERAVDQVRIFLSNRQHFRIAPDIVDPSRQTLVAVQRFVIGRAIGRIAPSAPLGEPRVPDDGKQPRARVVAPKTVEKAEGAQVGVLHNIVRVARAAAQPTCQVVCGIQMRQRHFGKAAGLVGCIHGTLLCLAHV
ncbi:hypothetical protein OR16_01325 [Cupriavidus basilensis OR16]|uniref:Uncharacterized protein n=1 Tax=Cupriavidus basilensis OR16 TaxID=1127483 RepID=H1RYE0_9BURK|nr:hypothetical protein OR16_01325 [Cupriavidus basilensis OR16]